MYETQQGCNNCELHQQIFFGLFCCWFFVGGLELNDLWGSFQSILWPHENSLKSFTPTVILLEIAIKFMAFFLLHDHHRQLLFFPKLPSWVQPFQSGRVKIPLPQKLPFLSLIPAEAVFQLRTSCSNFSFIYFMLTSITKQLPSATCLTGGRFVFDSFGIAEKCTREDLCWASEKIQEINI